MMTFTDQQTKLANKMGALGVLAALVVSASWLLVVPVGDAVGSHRAEMAALRERLSAVDAEAARVPGLRQKLTELNSKIGDESGLWTGTTDNAVSVAIQSRVRQLLQTSGANLSRLDASIVQDASGFRRHMLRVAFSGGDKELADVLVALARQRPYLRIDSLLVRGREVARPSEKGERVFASVVNVELELAGLGQGDDAGGARP